MDLQALFLRQHQRVYRLALLYFKNTSDAEDAVSSIFLKVAEKQPAFENEAHETAWFITATRNYCKDTFKSFWRKSVTLGDLPETPDSSSESLWVAECILRLPDKYRELLYLYYFEGYSVKELSALLSRKESTLQTQLADARKKLKRLLEKEGYVHE
ncbi:MAG: RNA polymerase sigma factor [Clostridia bacterium]|nr:RNA polymerase sigma factor [Clostridia bacterium]